MGSREKDEGKERYGAGIHHLTRVTRQERLKFPCFIKSGVGGGRKKLPILGDNWKWELRDSS